MFRGARLVGLVAAGCLAISRACLSAPIPTEVKSLVAFVFAPGKAEGELRAWGTAFFVGVQDPQHEGQSFVYIVTARHVLKGNDGKSWLPKIFVRLNTKAGDSRAIELPIVPDGPGRNVFTHPTDSAADVAVIPAVPDDKAFDFKFLPEEGLSSKEDFAKLKIVEGSEVFFTGLFSPHVGTRRNYPVVRFGKVAMITDEKVKFGDQEADLYLVDTGSYGGNSGSPVFFYLGIDRQPGSIMAGPPVLTLAGVMSGTFLDVQPVRAIENTPVAGAPSNMGIAAVVPAYKVREILAGKELLARRMRK